MGKIEGRESKRERWGKAREKEGIGGKEGGEVVIMI